MLAAAAENVDMTSVTGKKVQVDWSTNLGEHARQILARTPWLQIREFFLLIWMCGFVGACFIIRSESSQGYFISITTFPAMSSR